MFNSTKPLGLRKAAFFFRCGAPVLLNLNLLIRKLVMILILGYLKVEYLGWVRETSLVDTSVEEWSQILNSISK